MGGHREVLPVRGEGDDVDRDPLQVVGGLQVLRLQVGHHHQTVGEAHGEQTRLKFRVRRKFRCLTFDLLPVRICPTTNLIPVPRGDRDAVDRGGEGAVPDGLVRHGVPEDELLVLAAGEELQEKNEDT